MEPSILLLAIVGGLAVIAFVASLVIHVAADASHPAVRTLRMVAGALGICCAVIGVLIAIF